jgi:hypothetical protein
MYAQIAALGQPARAKLCDPLSDEDEAVVGLLIRRVFRFGSESEGSNIDNVTFGGFDDTGCVGARALSVGKVLVQASSTNLDSTRAITQIHSSSAICPLPSALPHCELNVPC